MNVVYKSKSQVRDETAEAIEQFLARGGQIEVVKARKAPKQKMSGKTTRQPSKGTSGFAVGFRRSSI